ncbi:MAG: hypothetical protein WCV00_08745, partial [Verrucomicrobiia bacterium]
RDGTGLGSALMSLLSFEGFAAFEVPTAHALIMAQVSSCARVRTITGQADLLDEASHPLDPLLGKCGRIRPCPPANKKWCSARFAVNCL